ncbi:peptide/nickel transport system ATP-binding protein [Devosia crocina]|uniref:Glutathione import ATP-binding protein GsiA n=1 Tax=Devosia crocina TaxID=429728 RepID=A0A1I7MXS1_9HYPH|nr:ABC transporter ATP-binding protein [Devosia crocina]SFV27180.1 peptide/nickel transport system ATP-binding protein [Devosia crocina]
MASLSRNVAVSILSVQHLTTQLRRQGQWNTVVDDVSFAIGANETVAVVGESGSGKSVTALSIMGLLPERTSKVSGRVLLDGADLLSFDEKQMQALRGEKIGMIFQEPMTSLNPVLTVGRQIAETLIRHRGLSRAQAKTQTIQLLDRVRIPAAARRFNEFPHELSGGMLQRVMIAMALACRPRLLIADEPTTALDVTIQAQILDLIKELQREENMGVLFITHDMGVVAEIADRTVVMFRSKALESGPTEDIFENSTQNYTRALLAAVPQLGSMAGMAHPTAFPIIDIATGATVPARESSDTVMPGKPVLKVDNLVTRFEIRSGLFGKIMGRVHAVENVSFSLQPGETLALVGESGCGKSTTGRSVLRLVEATSGSIEVAGEDVRAMPKRLLDAKRRTMQMIFQDPFSSLNPRMRIGEAIAEPLLSHGLETPAMARHRVTELLERVGLGADMAQRFPHEFSGGQRQRVAIARALALNPNLIVADEAVSALDVSVKAQVVNLMLELQERLKLAYLFISHDMAVVERVSHRVAVMYLGEIVEIGPRAEIFGNPQHPYTKKLLAAVPIADPKRRHLRRAVGNDEIRSPVRPADFIPPTRQYFEPTPGHVVQVPGAEWAA